MRMRCMLSVLVIAAVLSSAGALSAQEATPQPAPTPSPAAGYDIHVVAPHVVKGEEMGPFHHYCKPISPEPIIQCLIFESTDAAAPMTQIEYFVAKSLTRTMIERDDWNRDWHDHAVEIAGGRVQVLDMPEADAAKVAELAATTDGVIFHLWPHGSKIPTGEVSIAQAVGHVELSDEEYEASAAAPAP